MVKVTNDETKVRLESPYHPELPAKARDLGGKWTGTTWEFDPRDEDRVRSLARDVYGTDGSEDELVTVRLEFPNRSRYNAIVPFVEGHETWALGRQIMTRRGRDCEVTFGEGVVLLEGDFGSSGGSRKYPQIDPGVGDTEMVVLEVRDVPYRLVDEFDAEFEGVKLTIVSEVSEDPYKLVDVPDTALIAALEARGYSVEK